MCRIIEKAEPKADDRGSVRNGSDKWILERHFSQLSKTRFCGKARLRISQMKARDDALLRRSAPVFEFCRITLFEKVVPLLQEEQYQFGDIIVRKAIRPTSFYIC